MNRRAYFRNLYVILLCLPLMAAQKCFCDDTTDANGPTPIMHPTRLSVSLGGKYHYDETASAYVNGASWGKIGYASHDVDPGEYTITVITDKVPTTFKLTTTVKEFETKSVTIPCDPSHVTIVTDAALGVVFGITNITVTASGQSVTLVPGEEGTLEVPPGMNTKFTATDQDKKVITTTNVDLGYDSRFTWTVSK
jgi:hypothetical protein